MKRIYLKKTTFYLVFFIAVYLCISLTRLGAHQSPQTMWECSESGTEIVLDFGDPVDVKALAYYLGNYSRRGFSLSTALSDSDEWTELEDLVMVQPYQWRTVDLGITCRYLKFTTKNIYTKLHELVFIDRYGEQIRPVNISQYPELFDEGYCYQGKSTYATGTVFDEPVYARTAYEYLHGMQSFEDTHPPMGKILISIGIALFGMNPFGWRFSGVISGTLILILVSLFARRIFDNPWIPVFVTGMLAFDFMLFTHSRLAQIDSFLVLFMLGMFYFLYRYAEYLTEEKFHDNRRKAWMFMFLSGTCMGLAISCKWSGAYAVPGLVGMWFAYTISAFRKKQLSQKDLKLLLCWFTVTFVLVPMGIYILSYLPYVPVDRERGYFEALIRNQYNMFRFHTGITGSNPESAKWFQWPLMAMPITYCKLQLKGLQESVFLLGNPVLWLTGIAAAFYCLYDLWNTRNHKCEFLLIMYLSPMLPWVLIPRYSFLYHYFPCIPVLALMIGLCGEKHGKIGVRLMGVLVFISICVFVMFYPILSGLPIPVWYAEWLEWMPWWDF